LQNIPGTHAATWQQKLAADFPSFHFTQGENVIHRIHTKNSNSNCNSYCSLNEAFKGVTVGMDKPVKRRKPGPSFQL